VQVQQKRKEARQNLEEKGFWQIQALTDQNPKILKACEVLCSIADDGVVRGVRALA
jgi:hypothetical protein